MFQRAVGLARHMDQLAWISFPQEGEQVYPSCPFDLLWGHVEITATEHRHGSALLGAKI